MTKTFPKTTTKQYLLVPIFRLAHNIYVSVLTCNFTWKFTNVSLIKHDKITSDWHVSAIYLKWTFWNNDNSNHTLHPIVSRSSRAMFTTNSQRFELVNIIQHYNALCISYLWPCGLFPQLCHWIGSLTNTATNVFVVLNSASRKPIANLKK